MFNIFNLFERKIKEKESVLEDITSISEPVLSFIESVKNEKSRYRLSVIYETTGRFGDALDICLVDTSLKNTYLLSLIEDHRHTRRYKLRPLDSITVSKLKDPTYDVVENDTVSKIWVNTLRHVKISDLSWITEDEWEVLCKVLVKEVYRKRSIKRRKIQIKNQIRKNKKRKEFKKMYM